MCFISISDKVGYKVRLSWEYLGMGTIGFQWSILVIWHVSLKKWKKCFLI